MHARALDGAAASCRVYGINALYGRLIATLFLSATPLSLADLAKRTSTAKSTVSVAIRKMHAFRLVEHKDVAGDRRDFYVINLDFQRIFIEFIRGFVEREIEIGQELLKNLGNDLATLESSALDSQDRVVLSARVAAMANLTDGAQKWIQRLLDANRLGTRLVDALSFRRRTKD